ncbi:uncharacterized protein [Prorops nasuta]|uniref:uncharacterized protein n=1 Tax=Prorops nasuta TaxID=863751 RepID=UPI0034CEC0C6
MKDVICGSDITFEDKCVGPEDYSAKRNCISKYKSGFHGYESIVSDEEMNTLAGVRIKVFQLLLTLIVNVNSEKISKENYLLLFLMKIKLGLSSSALGVLFNIHRTTTSRYFKNSLQILVIKCKDLITWPSKGTIKELLPDAFKDKYRNCRIIIDCTEFPTEQPAEISQRVQFYSHYKKGFTIKVLVGCTPNGYISIISKSYGGRTTDTQITNESGLLNLLEPGDMVLADKGFPSIKAKLDELGNGVILVMPPFLKNNYFSAAEVNETQEIAINLQPPIIKSALSNMQKMIL